MTIGRCTTASPHTPVDDLIAALLRNDVQQLGSGELLDTRLLHHPLPEHQQAQVVQGLLLLPGRLVLLCQPVAVLCAEGEGKTINIGVTEEARGGRGGRGGGGGG